MSNKINEKDIERRIKIKPNTQAKLHALANQIAHLRREINDRIEMIADQMDVKPNQSFTTDDALTEIIVFKMVKNVTDKEAAIIEEALAAITPPASAGD